MSQAELLGFEAARVLKQRLIVAWLIGCVIATSVSPANAQSSDPIFDAAGFQQHRDYFSATPSEHIDTLTGSLILTNTDLVLPGNAGRELRFQLWRA